MNTMNEHVNNTFIIDPYVRDSFTISWVDETGTERKAEFNLPDDTKCLRTSSMELLSFAIIDLQRRIEILEEKNAK